MRSHPLVDYSNRIFCADSGGYYGQIAQTTDGKYGGSQKGGQGSFAANTATAYNPSANNSSSFQNYYDQQPVSQSAYSYNPGGHSKASPPLPLFHCAATYTSHQHPPYVLLLFRVYPEALDKLREP
jgi:hypothetical protein